MWSISNGALRGLRAVVRSPAAGTLKQRFTQVVLPARALQAPQSAKLSRATQLRLCASGGAGGSTGSGGRGGGGGGGSGSGGSSSNQPGGLMAFVAMYLAALEAHPIPVKSLTAAVLNALGDLLCQLLVEKSSSVDTVRTAKFAGLGLLLVGPVMHNWYGLLSKVVTAKGSAGVLTRLALDQLVFAPVFISTFIAALMTMDGAKPEAIKAKLQADLFTSVKVNWTLWVPAQYINFKYVPVNLQVLASNVTALVWNTYMSFMSNRKVDVKKA